MPFVKYYSIEEVVKFMMMNYIEFEEYKESHFECHVKIVRYGVEAEFQVEVYSPDSSCVTHIYRVSVIKENDIYKIASRTGYIGEYQLAEVINFERRNGSNKISEIVVEKDTDVVLEKLQLNIEQGLITKEEVQREECGQRYIPLLNENKYTELIKVMGEDYKEGKIGERDYNTVVAEIRSMRMNSLFGKGW